MSAAVTGSLSSASPLSSQSVSGSMSDGSEFSDTSSLSLVSDLAGELQAGLGQVPVDLSSSVTSSYYMHAQHLFQYHIYVYSPQR